MLPGAQRVGTLASLAAYHAREGEQAHSAPPARSLCGRLATVFDDSGVDG